MSSGGRNYVSIDPATDVARPEDLGDGSDGSGSHALLDDGTWGSPPSGSPSGAAGGDLSGTYPNPAVVDDSHAHGSGTAPGVSDSAGPDADVTIDAAGAAGTAATRARHLHGHKVATTDAPSGADITVDAAATAAATGTIARAAHGHKVATTDAPSGATITIDAAATAAATGAIARAAHGHRMNTYGSGGGTSGTAPARGDHTGPVAVASGGSHAAGHVPDPGASSGTTKFLREDMTFAVPAGTSAAPDVAEDGSTVVSGATSHDFRHGLDVTAPGGGAARIAVDESEFTYGSTGDMAAEAFGSAVAAGSSGKPADAGHRHAIQGASTDTEPSGNTTMTTANTWYDAVSVSLGAGVWEVWWKLGFETGGGTLRSVYGRLLDSTNSVELDYVESWVNANGYRAPVSGFARFTLAGTVTLKAQATSDVNTNTISRDGGKGTGHYFTRILCRQIG